MTRPWRIGFYGGSFDPVHLAHRAVADAAVKVLGLDELRWVIAGQPWQKSRRLASAHHRIELVRLATADDPRQRVETAELHRPGPSYTIDTLQQLIDQHAATGHAPAEWFLILGQDQYNNLHTWHRWTELIEATTLVIAPRPVSKVRLAPGQQPVVAVPPALADRPHRRVVLPLAPYDHSSTAVRAALAAGLQARRLAEVGVLLPEVAHYIDAFGLYHPDPAGAHAPNPGTHP